MEASSFRHGVASGDPTPDGVVIWTRVSGKLGDVEVRWWMARDPQGDQRVAEGAAIAAAERDHTVHVDVGGLEPDTVYYYGFAKDDEHSPGARTKTLPGTAADRLRFVFCSCAKFNAGFFNAYSRIAERRDLDFVLHLGDYIYEASNTPPPPQTPGADIGRPFDPLGECRTLAEYRTRYAQYRSDPDVQALHHALPMIATLDDHELADGAWSGGADAHVEAEHGPWAARRDAAFRARWEWLPARPPDPDDLSRVFREVRVGDLAQILLLDIRSRRDQPVVGSAVGDPDRSMLGAEQRAWLESALDEPFEGWRVIGSPSVMTRTWVEHPTEPLATALLKLKLIDEDGEGPDEDQWDGYHAERRHLTERFRSLDDTVVLSADIHVSLAGILGAGSGSPAAVEITSPSMTSQNLDEKLEVEPRSEPILAAERAFLEAFDATHWCELASHGYVVCDIDAERLRAEWWHVDGVLERLPGERLAAAYEVPRGELTLNASV
jgi:phosphodiesterase/alkaline phosphatase D-like protein